MLDTATFAASWWADQLQAPKFDDGAGGAHSDFTSRLAELTRSVQPAVGGAIEAFKVELGRVIQLHLDTRYSPMMLGVDYRPDTTLQAAMSVADIKMDLVVALPWKTTMTITKSEVKVNGKLLFAVDAP